MPAKYNADGTGRDTYIRRDPVECFGKSLYKAEPRLITRFGEAGSKVARERGRPVGETDPVGGHHGGMGFERPARFLRPTAESYPVPINRFSTMKEVVQDAYVSTSQQPGYLNHISGYQGFKPRCPPNSVGWVEVSHAEVYPSPEITSWPDLVNVRAEEAAARIQQDRPDVEVVVLPPGTSVDSEHRLDRVKMHIDETYAVTSVPQIG